MQTECMEVYDVIISLASNNQQEQNLHKAQAILAQILSEPYFSDAIWTKPFGIDDASVPLYLNQLVFAKTQLTAEQINVRLKEIESQLGRTQEQKKKGIVSIDLDLLQHNNTKFHLSDWERPYIKQLIK